MGRLMNKCGVCGGELRLYGKHGWRHVAAPLNTQKHTAIVGTPVDWSKVKIEPGTKIKNQPDEVVTATEIQVAPATEVEAEGLVAGPGKMAKLAMANDWAILARQNELGISVACTRGRERVVGVWYIRDGKISFEFGATMWPTPRPLNLGELKGMILHDATCDACGEQVTTHGEECHV